MNSSIVWTLHIFPWLLAILEFACSLKKCLLHGLSLTLPYSTVVERFVPQLGGSHFLFQFATVARVALSSLTSPITK